MADIISEAFKQAAAKLKSVGDDIDKLPKIVSTFLIVYSAQGVLDNGGYRYFFESDWPDNQQYSKFIEACSEIGCIKQSTELARVISTFPFENPHLDESARNKYIDSNLDEEEFELKGWGDALCGDQEVWTKLEAYYLDNKEEFV